jgi:hypothetical protein
MKSIFNATYIAIALFYIRKLTRKFARTLQLEDTQRGNYTLYYRVSSSADAPLIVMARHDSEKFLDALAQDLHCHTPLCYTCMTVMSSPVAFKAPITAFRQYKGNLDNNDYRRIIDEIIKYYTNHL